MSLDYCGKREARSQATIWILYICGPVGDPGSDIYTKLGDAVALVIQYSSNKGSQSK